MRSRKVIIFVGLSPTQGNILSLQFFLMKCLVLKLGVEKSGVEMSFNHQINLGGEVFYNL